MGVFSLIYNDVNRTVSMLNQCFNFLIWAVFPEDYDPEAGFKRYEDIQWTITEEEIDGEKQDLDDSKEVGTLFNYLVYCKLFLLDLQWR